ncbi:hypothetical protein GCM10012275_15420 [Longimycelium tulufanense]|uniref:Uncharacterized protein n=1 Tax=Longimycelium tulufanense TaxID=907463 RepID=A0A8J3FTE4_9PSEU|nr:hypothetical protein GCM10012275_15420 [Longimycelium tulufanense]
MHLRVAGQVRRVQVLDRTAQILNEDGTPFSSPILLSESGIFVNYDSNPRTYYFFVEA